MKQPFDKPGNIFETQIDALFKKKEVTDTEQILQLVPLILHQNGRDSDLGDVYRLLGLEKFSQLVTLLDGRTIKFPTTIEIQETIVLAFCYYYKEVKGLGWEEIRAIIPWDIAPTVYGARIKNLSKYVKDQIINIMLERV